MAHEHNVTDSDNHFKIDTKTREITNESGKTVLMQHDHNSERLTFEMPQYVENHDMADCNQIQVHYRNTDLSTGIVFDDVYEVTDFSIEETLGGNETDSVFSFSWLVSGNATQYVGPLDFSIRFACVADDGTVEYVWNTAVHFGIVVSPGFYNSEIVIATFSDVLETRMARYNAMLEGWYNDLYLASVGEGVSPEEVREMIGVVSSNAVTVTLPAANWVNGVQTVEVAGVTGDSENCHVFATYHPGSYEQYRDSYVRNTAQGDGTLTFTCETALTPTTDILVNIAIFA